MIEPATLREIIATYAKHGWLLRRVLLSAGSRPKLDEADAEEYTIIDSETDAAWFSRPPKPGGVAWELRHLGGSPFALLENIDEFADNFETALTEVETRLRSAVQGKEQA